VDLMSVLARPDYEQSPSLPAGVEGPPVPANGQAVDVEIEECHSCGWGPTKGKAWLVRSGVRNVGEICIRCTVCYMTLLGDHENGESRGIVAKGVAGATNMILEAIERAEKVGLLDVFVRVSAHLAKRDLHDHVDANEYGGLCDAGYLLAWGLPTDIEHVAGNRVQDQVNDWIGLGGLTRLEKDPVGGTPPNLKVVKEAKHTDSDCPSCGAADVQGSNIEIDSGYAFQPMGCGACGASWRNVYAFSSCAAISP
jgi:hypothetical protein